MRKLALGLLLALIMLVCAPALADSYIFDDVYSSIEMPEGYTVLTPDNLSSYATWLEARGSDEATVSADFTARGVLLQGWSEANDVCFEVTAVQNDQTYNIFDVNEQSESVRGTYRTSFYPNNEYEGYDFSASNWKNTDNGRFLVLRYVRRNMGEILYRGLMRRTIRNGYEITLDMQIIGRAVTNKDNSNLNKIWNTYHFVEVMPMPAAASAKINITSAPPKETNEAGFTISGTAAKDVKLTSVVMGLNYPKPIVSDVIVPASGKFKLPIALPKEGVFLITITGEYQGTDVVELAYPVTYQRTLLTVNITSEVPTVVSESTLTVLGNSEPGAGIQVFINGEGAFTKKVTGEGRFKVEIPTKEEGPYEITLVFSKKNLADRRITLNFTRSWSDADRLKQLSQDAIKPAYNQLVNKIEGYVGRVMGYKAYITHISQSGEDWIIQMALTKRGTSYDNVIIVTSKEAPNFAVGERVTMYGTCTGMSVGASNENTDENGEVIEENFPCFELLLLATLE